MAILIVTMPNDADARLVKLALGRLGAECDVFYSVDFAGGAEWFFDPNDGALESSFRGRVERFEFSRYDSVWMRRPCGATPRLHLADTHERVAAEGESLSFLNSMLRTLEDGKFVANPLSRTRIASEKPYQFRIAQEVGLTMPATIISNSRQRIVEFFHQCAGQLVYKSLVPSLWRIKHATYRSALTTEISDIDVLLKSDLRSAPGIFQRKVRKQAEVRVTILGRTVLAVEKRFPRRPESTIFVDWRPMQTGAVYQPCHLPSGLEQRCHALLDRLGLVMGCFDFAVDTEGQFHFLEVNPQGQFLCYDHVCPEMNHLEAMAKFLISRDPSFVYTAANRVRLAELDQRETHESLEAQERALHFSDLQLFRFASMSVPQLDAEHVDAPDFAAGNH